MNRIKIEGIDTLFFKDGKPFSMGEESWADGIFPPSPSVFYGCLRSAYLGLNGGFDKIGTSDDPTSKLIIKEIFLSIGDDLFLPVPADLVVKSEEFALDQSLPKFYPLQLGTTNILSNSKFNSHLFFDGGELVERNDLCIMRSSFFENYLENNTHEINCLQLNDYLLTEPKTGIGRSNINKTAADGMLYRVGMKRPSAKGYQNDKLSFIIGFDGFDLPENGFLKLGAEGKIASYQNISQNKLLNGSINAPSLSEGKIKLVILTPAFFENGSIPNLSSEKFSKYNMQLITSSVYGFVSIGGFDMKNNKPKPMRRAVKPGSVYYFSFEGDKEEIVRDFHMKSISEYDSANQGFGITAVGGF